MGRKKISEQFMHMGTVQEPETVEAEEIVEMPETPQTLKELPVMVDLSVKKFDPFVVKLKEMREEFSKLEIAGKDDKDGMEAMRKAVAKLRGYWVATDKAREAWKKPLTMASKAVEQKAQWLIGEFQDIAAPLQKRMKEIKDELEADKAAAIEAENKRFSERTVELLGFGARYDQATGYFILDDQKAAMALVKGVDEDIYQSAIRAHFEQIFLAKEKVREQEAEAARLKAIADEAEKKKLREQQEKLEADRQKLLKDQAEADRVKKQQELQAKNIRVATRRNQLAEKGMEFTGQYYRAYNVLVTQEALVDFEDDKWQELIDWVFPAIEQNRAAEAEQKLKDEAEEMERKRQEDLAQADDRSKWIEIVAYLKKCPNYEMKSPAYKGKVNKINNFIAEL